MCVVAPEAALSEDNMKGSAQQQSVEGPQVCFEYGSVSGMRAQTDFLAANGGSVCHPVGHCVSVMAEVTLAIVKKLDLDISLAQGGRLKSPQQLIINVASSKVSVYSSSKFPVKGLK